jgi:HEAT repeat protein
MRRIVFTIVLITLSGCGGARPPMAGGKWAQALRDPDAKMRRKAAFTLGNIGSSDPAALPAVIGGLKDTDAGVRREAILALVKIGAVPQDGIASLRVMRKEDRDAQVRAYAAKALESLQGTKARASREASAPR